VTELGIAPHTERHEDLAAQLLMMFETVKEEERLAVMIRSAAMMMRRAAVTARLSRPAVSFNPANDEESRQDRSQH
jgi:hypothetical protein